MSFAVSDYQTATLPPRHLRRRLGAFLIDIIFFQIVFTVLFLALSTVTSWDVTLPFLHEQHCDTTTSGPLVSKMEAEWPLQPGETRTNRLCQISWLGSKGYKVFVSVVASQQGTTKTTHALSLPVDDNGNPIDPNGTVRPISSIAILLLPFAFAFCSAAGRRTLGKRLLSLRIRTIKDQDLSLGLAAKRELFKFLPLILLAVFNLVSLFLLRPAALPIDQLIQQARDTNLPSAGGFFALTSALAPMLFVFTLIWWLYPLFVWRGQTFYDRFCDTKLVKD